jgi:hypothetical protein
MSTSNVLLISSHQPHHVAVKSVAESLSMQLSIICSSEEAIAHLDGSVGFNEVLCDAYLLRRHPQLLHMIRQYQDEAQLWVVGSYWPSCMFGVECRCLSATIIDLVLKYGR